MARKILFVDDDPNAQRLVSYALQVQGYEVAVAASGAEALERLGTERPDLVILDVMMPDMSGLDVCRRIRAERATAHLPILMLSARGLVADRISGLKSGADDYLCKPADTGELIARVEALLSRASYASTHAARVLAIIGVKGGVGTTTVATNVAAEMAEHGRSVCLVELRNGAGSAAALLKLQPAHDLGDLLAQPAGPSLPGSVSRTLIRHVSGLRLLAAPRGGSVPCDISPELVDALTGVLTQEADCVVFDLPASWSAANQAALRHASFTAAVCELDSISLSCAGSTLASLQQWGIMGDLVGIVLVNRISGPNLLSVPAARAALSAGLVGVIPPASDAATIAAREGVPLVTLQPKHLASVALKDLAARLMQDRIRLLQ